MNSLYKQHVMSPEAEGCYACFSQLEDIGPINGPKPPPWRVERWGMTPAEWAGQVS